MHLCLVKTPCEFIYKLNADFWLLASFAALAIANKSWHSRPGPWWKECFSKAFTSAPQKQCLPLSPQNEEWPWQMAIKWLQAWCVTSFSTHIFLPSWWALLRCALPGRKVMVCPRSGQVKEARWKEETTSALIPFHTPHSQMKEEGITSPTGLSRPPHLGELIHTWDKSSPTFAQLWRKGRSSFNTKKFNFVCSPYAMKPVGKRRGLCFPLPPFLHCKVRGNLIFSLHIFLDSELFTHVCLEPDTCTVA